MLTFGDTLKLLLNHNKMKDVDLCKMIGINKAYLSRLKSGKIPIKDYDFAKRIADAMELTNFERKMLMDSYKVSRFGEDYLILEQAIEKVYHTQLPLISNKNTDEIQLPMHGEMIGGMEKIAKLANVLLSSEETMLLFIPENSEFCRVLCQSSLEKNTHSKWLLFLGSEEKEVVTNISIFPDILQMMFKYKLEMRFIYSHLGDYLSNTIYPYLFIGKDSVLMIKRDCESAFFFQDANMVSSCKQFVRNKYESATTFLTIFNSYEVFLNNWKRIFCDFTDDRKKEVLIIEKWPCIVHEATGEDMFAHIRNTEVAYSNAMAYLEFHQWMNQQLRTQEIIFTEDGMDEYFRMEEFYEFSKQITTSIDKTKRKEFFVKLITFSEMFQEMVPELMREPLFLESNIRVINVWSNGMMLIVFQFEETYRVVVLQEKSISNAFWGYFRKLKEDGVVLSKTKTLEIMKKKLHELQN